MTYRPAFPKPGTRNKKAKKRLSKRASVKTLDRKLWDLVSKFVRMRDADQNGICKCITCQKHDFWKKMHAGHCIPRNHKGVKFDEHNVNAQCCKCNTFEEGRKDVYMVELDRKWGKGTYQALLVADKLSKGPDRFAMEMLIKVYQKKVKEQEKRVLQ